MARTVAEDMDFFDNLFNHLISVRDQLFFGELGDNMTPVDIYEYLRRIEYVNEHSTIYGRDIDSLNREFDEWWNRQELSEAEAVEKIYREFTTDKEKRNPKTLPFLCKYLGYTVDYEFDDGSFISKEDIDYIYQTELDKVKKADETAEFLKMMFGESEDTDNGKEE